MSDSQPVPVRFVCRHDGAHSADLSATPGLHPLPCQNGSVDWGSASKPPLPVHVHGDSAWFGESLACSLPGCHWRAVDERRAAEAAVYDGIAPSDVLAGRYTVGPAHDAFTRHYLTHPRAAERFLALRPTFVPIRATPGAVPVLARRGPVSEWTIWSDGRVTRLFTHLPDGPTIAAPSESARALISGLLESEGGESPIPWSELAEIVDVVDEREIVNARDRAPWHGPSVSQLTVTARDGGERTYYRHSVGYSEGVVNELYRTEAEAMEGAGLRSSPPPPHYGCDHDDAPCQESGVDHRPCPSGWEYLCGQCRA